ncbi:methylated-DNA--[protein]-cysteine S-methyltransferase [Jannaschia sp. S6380]|uniref:methylated-DNA--[protein]-cysteine S-methyltransferase n=1 Tax=Jannaschia sp. S6380 TaxID=2926408 RepID=UPI001FF3DEFA|nr:methylated-DNA--[protein]-cysteine S-methyltransferase [Jannaschia sp. S6380]MCK0167972.1 methylated-DNA--[protein]-cysteine S-methyltransferase [Jannaschia sp. S6380]
MIRTARLETVYGPVWVAGADDALAQLRLPGNAPDPDWTDDPDAFPEARRQLGAYFDRKLTTFDLDLAPEGTDFQRRVWAALRDIPFGQTASYADIARTVGRPGGTQAVGQANGRNPLPVVIPCHRVIGADGSLGGFSGGTEMKRILLDLEGLRFEDAQPRLL